ncbi:MAG: hypothetical protein SNJ33_06170 [Rikenellaceae bacterium]
MKRFLIIAAMAAITATSCTKSEVVDIATGKAMSFDITTNATTKAETLTASTLGTFSVYAWEHGSTAWALLTGSDYSSLSSFMTAETMTVQSDNSEVKASTTYYWPTESSTKISFFAYASSASDAVSNFSDMTSATTDASYPSFSYTVQDVGSQEDLLVGTVTDQSEGDIASAVAFALDHALAKVTFKASGEDSQYTYRVTAFRINKVANTGTFTYKATDNSGVDGAWGATSGETFYAIEVNSGSSTATNDSSYYWEIGGDTTSISIDDDEALMIMPQTLADYILVEYSVYNGTTLIQEEAWATAQLSDIVLAAGSYSIFSLVLPSSGGNVSDPTTPETEDSNLASTEMTFSVSVSESWATTVTPDEKAVSADNLD